MNEFIKQNWFKIVIAIVTLVIGVSIGYYFIVFLPQKERIRLDQERAKIELEEQKQLSEEQEKQRKLEQETLDKKVAEQQVATNREKLTECLASAYVIYSNEWATDCKKFANEIVALCNTVWIKQGLGDLNECIARAGYPDISGSPSCNLPVNAANNHNSNYKELKDECYKLYFQS